MKTLRATGYFLCQLNGKGDAVSVAKRMTLASIERLENRRQDGRLFVVAAWLVIDRKAEDHGTVYFFDRNGAPVNVVNC